MFGQQVLLNFTGQQKRAFLFGEIRHEINKTQLLAGVVIKRVAVNQHRHDVPVFGVIGSLEGAVLGIQ